MRVVSGSRETLSYRLGGYQLAAAGMLLGWWYVLSALGVVIGFAGCGVPYAQ